MSSLLSAKQMLVELSESGLTDEQIAEETRVSQPTITRIRNGVHAEPRHSTWAAINEAYVRRLPPPAAASTQAPSP